jgi:hypothetical protein
MYTSLNFEADDRPPGGSFWHQYNFAGSITMVFASGVASALDSLNCAVSGASSGRGEGRTIKDARGDRRRVPDELSAPGYAARGTRPDFTIILSCVRRRMPSTIAVAPMILACGSFG